LTSVLLVLSFLSIVAGWVIILLLLPSENGLLFRSSATALFSWHNRAGKSKNAKVTDCSNKFIKFGCYFYIVRFLGSVLLPAADTESTSTVSCFSPKDKIFGC